MTVPPIAARAAGAMTRRNSAASAHARCGVCRHFRDDPHVVEALTPGLASMSSGFASVRGDDGICVLHGRHLSARASCAGFDRDPTP